MANFTFDKPFQIELADKQMFTAEKVVRILPKRRLVAFGTWSGKPVVAKLFFASKHAARHVEKDAAGIQEMTAINSTFLSLISRQSQQGAMAKPG